MTETIVIGTNIIKQVLLHCRNCESRTLHKRAITHSLGYACSVCGTWQHESQVIEIIEGSAARMILNSLNDDEVHYSDGTVEEFIEAAECLRLYYDYWQTSDGYNFLAWSDDSDNSAKVALPLE